MHEDRSFRAMLQRSLDLLREESPLHYVGVFRQLEGLELDIEVDEERFVLYANRGAHTIIKNVKQSISHSSKVIRLKSTRSTLINLTNGHDHLLDALRALELEVLASTDTLQRLDRALHSYINGALRSSSHPLLHNAFVTENRS